ETPRRAMLKLIGSVNSVRKLVDGTFLRRAIHDLFAPALTREDVDEMIEGATVKSHAAGEVLFAEGDEPDGLHVIRRGSATITRPVGGNDVVLSYVAAGNYVGEMALMSADRRNATVRAAVNTETVVLQAQAFKQVLARRPELRSRLSTVVLDRLSKRGNPQ